MRRQKHKGPHHLPVDRAAVLSAISEPDFFTRWTRHLNHCPECSLRLDEVLSEIPVPPKDSQRRLPEVPMPKRIDLLRLGLLAVGIVLTGLYALERTSSHRVSNEILVVAERSSDGVPSRTDSTPVPIVLRVLPTSGGAPTEETAIFDPSIGVARVPLKRAAEGIVMVEAQAPYRLAGTTSIESGSNVLLIGGPGSAPYEDNAVVRSLHENGSLGRGLSAVLPFVASPARAGSGNLVHRRLEDGVSVFYIDDVQVFDDHRLIWKETLEDLPDGPYPPAPMVVLSPSAPLDGAPQGGVIETRASEGSKSFQSISLPRLARFDGIPVRPEDVTSELLRFSASIQVPTTDARGALIGLKLTTQRPWTDTAGILMSFGEIRTWPGNQTVGFYEPDQWVHVEVVIDLDQRTISVQVDGSASSSFPLPKLESAARTEEVGGSKLEFDHFAFGGLFFHRDDFPAQRMKLPVVNADGDAVTYRLNGGVSGWQATDLSVRTGDRVSIIADGEIYFAGPGDSRTDPDGCRLHLPDPCAGRRLSEEQTPSLVPGLWIGALAGRVGEDGAGFLVGRSCSFVAERDGVLQLACNDSYYGDNRGSYTVTVRRP